MRQKNYRHSNKDKHKKIQDQTSANMVIVVFLCFVQNEEDLWEVPVSIWKLLELTSVSRFMAYVTCPHKWRISVAFVNKKALREKNIIHP
jgi:hypothetical protein